MWADGARTAEEALVEIWEIGVRRALPVRARRPDPIPPAREFMRRCLVCAADFMALAPGKTREVGLWCPAGWCCSQQCFDDRRAGAHHVSPRRR